jgi:hypothetical protein
MSGQLGQRIEPGACSDEIDAPTDVIAGLDPAISINMARVRMLCARASIIEMAGTSPAMTIPRERDVL